MSETANSTAPGTIVTQGGYLGNADWWTQGSGFNVIDFMIRQVIAKKAWSGLVGVRAVHGGGATGIPPTVDVQPMVGQIDGFGNITPHGIVYGLPCFRLQGGNGAIVLDPAVGDIGQAVICDRDISTVKKTRAVAGPGSRRQNDWADGCYFGGFLNAAPTQYVAFSTGGISVVTPGTLTIQASNATLDASGNLTLNGNVVWNAGGTATHAATHVHTNGNLGADTGAPVAGT